MNNVIKNGFFSIIGLSLIGLNNVNAAINPGTGVDAGLRTEWSADTVIQAWLGNLLTFLYLIAVLIAVWWGFNILTAAWDEEKVKKWKTILIQAWIGLFVIFIAWSLIQWILWILGWQ